MATILHIIDHLGTGGAQTILAQICKASVTHGDGAIVVSLRSQDSIWFRENAGSDTRIFDSESRTRISALIAMLRLLHRVRRLIQNDNVSVVHSHLPASQLFAILLRILCRGIDIRWCTSVYGTRLQIPAYYRFVLPMGMLWNDILFSIMQDYELPSFFRLRCRVVKIPFTSSDLPDGTIGLEETLEHCGVCADDTLLIGVARLSADKLIDRYEPLFAMIGSYSYGKLMFVGSGELLDEYRRKAQAEHWGNVSFPGYIRESRALYQRADIMVTTSINSHFSVAALNAAAHGCLVVSLNIGTQQREVEIATSGAPQYLRMLSCKSDAAFLKAVQRLLCNHELRKRVTTMVDNLNSSTGQIRNLELYHSTYHGRI